MQYIKMSDAITIAVLLLVLSVERVIGVPVVSFILFYHLFSSRKMLIQGLALTFFSLIVASVYVIDPVLTTSSMLAGYIFLQFQQAPTTQSKSWSYVYVSLIQAIGIAFLAGMVVTSAVIFSFIVQGLIILIFLRKVVFNGISQVFHWQKRVHSSELHEKIL